MTPNSISIFTDGSSRGNPGPGGWGAIVAVSCKLQADSFEEKVTEIGGREERTTNNRMELLAAIEALRFIESLQLTANSLKLYTDSTYLINGITKWIFGWKKNGWMTKAKKDVENKDLWELLDSVANGKRIEWIKVEGHSGHGANERCDEIATSFADGLKPKLYSGPVSGYKISLETAPQGPIAHGTRASKKEIMYVSFVGGVGNIDKTWSECEARVRGKTGARFKKVRSREEAETVLAVWREE